MTKFKVGDIVRFKESITLNSRTFRKGKRARVVYSEHPCSGALGVHLLLKKKDMRFHNCQGRCNDGEGWFIDPSCVEAVNG